MGYSQQPTTEVREPKKVDQPGVEVVRRGKYPDDTYIAHVPNEDIGEVIEELAKYAEDKEVVTAEEAELIELAKEKLCD
jgi:hypothetical protein